MTDRIPDVVFGIPNYSHMFSKLFVQSMMETQSLLNAANIHWAVINLPGDCFVDKARNKIVTEFLQNHHQVENLFFIDDDIGWPAQKVFDFIRRPDDIVAGVYPKKSKTTDWPCSFLRHPDKGELIESEGLLLAILAPTGFMRIKRRVLETLAEQCSMFEDATDDGYRSFIYMFESGKGANGRYWGEDYTFCQKVIDAGFNIWIDPNIPFRHMGTYTWEGNLSEHLDQFRERAMQHFEGALDDDCLPVAKDAAE